MAITPYRKVVQPDNSGSQLLRGVLQVGGTAVGGFFGGPGGAAAGGALGGALGGAVAPDKEAEIKESKPIESAGGGDSGAMARRLGEMNSNPSVQIADANAAIAKMPPDIQQEYGPTLSQAQKLSMNRRV